MPKNNMPENWVPPYPSWSAKWGPQTDSLVIAYFSAQSQNADTQEFHTWFQSIAASENGPKQLERSHFTDAHGYHNEMYTAYWTSPDAFDLWWASASVQDWWSSADREQGDVGYWKEKVTVPLQRFETLLSSVNSVGAAATSDEELLDSIEEHGYWGGMRDRIPESDNNTFASTAGDVLNYLKPREGDSKRVVIQPPENLCIIRSGQNWTKCKSEERDFYLREVHSVLKLGMDYLRDNPLDSGCASCRLADELSDDGRAIEKTFGLAYFLSMADLETWSKTHPTHLEIFGKFHSMAQAFNFELDLELWHEVLVAPGQGCEFEYLNCHANTGLRPFFADRTDRESGV